MTECERFRRQLSARARVVDDAHTGSCASCAAFAARWSEIEGALGRPADAPPSPGFAQRVRARLPEAPHPVVRMAEHFLPVALALVAALTLWVGAQWLDQDSEAVAPADEVVAWVVSEAVEAAGEGR